MHHFRTPPAPMRNDRLFFGAPFLFGAPLVGGFLGGLAGGFVGSSFNRPRPYPFYPPYPYPPYYGPYGYGGYGRPYF